MGIAGVGCSSDSGGAASPSWEDAGAAASHGKTPDEAWASFFLGREARGSEPVAAGRAEGIWPVAGNSASSAGCAGVSAFVRADASE